MARRVLLAVIAGCAALAAVPGAALAGTLDQQQTMSDTDAGVGSTQTVAQSFTAGISGQLDRVDLLVFHVIGASVPLNVAITDASASGPGSTILATASVPVTATGISPGFVPFTFAAPATVTAGAQYAIVAYSADSGNRYGWNYQSSNVYPRGFSFFTNDPFPGMPTWILQGGGAGVDQAFKTYVVPPPPPPPANTGKRAAALKKCKKKARERDWSHKKLKKCKKKARALPI